MPRSYPNARERILDAAERLLLRDGLDALSVDAVLAEAAISKGGFFHHFASKETLLSAILERLNRVVGEQAALAMKHDQRAYGRALRAMIGMAFDMPIATRERTRALVLALIRAAMDSPKIAASARKANDDAIAQSAADGVDVGRALLVQFALDGFFLAESLRTVKLNRVQRSALREALLGLVAPPSKAPGHAR
jgi:AcrR family transcriptional regulator